MLLPRAFPCDEPWTFFLPLPRVIGRELYLDMLQALTTSFRYHYLPIQLAGLSMYGAE